MYSSASGLTILTFTQREKSPFGRFSVLLVLACQLLIKYILKKIPYLELKRIFFYYEYGGSLLKTPLTN